MQQPAKSMTGRKKQLRKLGYFLGVLLIFFWASVYLWPEEYVGFARHWINESSLALPISIGISLLVFTLCCFLYYGNEDGWWGVIYLIFLLPAAIMLMLLFPMAGVVILFLFHGLYQTRPPTTMMPTSIPREVDELAAAMNIHWEEQPIWNLVNEARQGKVDQAVKSLRNTYHMTWDEADKAIRRWMDDELGFKLHLLKLHAQTLAKQNS